MFGKTLLEHEHELELMSYNKRFTCDGCKEEGYGTRYRCELCGYELHSECRFPQRTIRHEFFEACTFEFYTTPQTTCGDSLCKHHQRCCDACGKDINGYVYHSKADDWDLHPCCSNLRSRIHIDDTDFILRSGVSTKCLWCKKKKLWEGKSRVRGWSYVSTSEKYCFHVHCVKKMVNEAWRNGNVDDSFKTLEKIELKLLAKTSKKGKRNSMFWRTVRIFLKMILSVLLGDPTIVIVPVLGELFSH